MKEEGKRLIDRLEKEHGLPRAERYRLDQREIMECCREGEKLGFRTFVLQGGEDSYYTDDRMVDLIRGIRKAYPHCAITLSKTSSTKSIPGTPQTAPVESERDRLPDRVRIYGGNRAYHPTL